MRVQTAALLLAASTAYGFAPSTVRAPVSSILPHMWHELNGVIWVDGFMSAELELAFGWHLRASRRWLWPNSAYKCQCMLDLFCCALIAIGWAWKRIKWLRIEWFMFDTLTDTYLRMYCPTSKLFNRLLTMPSALSLPHLPCQARADLLFQWTWPSHPRLCKW